jgi:3-oxoacyl-[acyl-carrier protein] reductase
MDLGLAGRKCVVLGASRGIGRAIALGLAAEGAAVGVCARDPGPLEEVAATIRGRGQACHAATCDLADRAALAAYLRSARETLGGLDVLVHNASALAVGPDAAAWQASLDVDLLAGVHACETVVPWMQASGGGSILLVSSVAGLEASPMPDFAYTTVKAAIIAYAKKLAVAQGPHGIRVNSIAPGSVDFPGGIWDRVHREQPDFYAAVVGSIPMGRMGTPEEVADVAVFLASDRARWVTGACVPIDGAQHRRIP